MEVIDVQASEIWEYFEENKFRLKDHMHRIAKNDEYGVEIYLTNDDGNPSFLIAADGTEIYSVTAVDQKSCESLVKEIYDNYLTYKLFEKLSEDKDSKDDEEEELTQEQLEAMEIEFREDDMNYAVKDMLDVFLGGGGVADYFDNVDDICEELKDIICELLYCKYRIEPYRPSYVEYDDGTVKYEEYPYSEIELEHEDNPLFQP